MKTKNIPFTEEEARAMYPDASKELREKLEATFGIKVLTTDPNAMAMADIRDIVKTYEDACRINGETPVDDEQMKAAGFTDDEIALRKLKSITKALNQGQTFSWEDSDQQKWFPYFFVSPSGFSFSDALRLLESGRGHRLPPLLRFRRNRNVRGQTIHRPLQNINPLIAKRHNQNHYEKEHH